MKMEPGTQQQLIDGLRHMEIFLNCAIVATPTGPMRNDLADMNILRMRVLESLEVQNELQNEDKTV
jgi:hypothetical protein